MFPDTNRTFWLRNVLQPVGKQHYSRTEYSFIRVQKAHRGSVAKDSTGHYYSFVFNRLEIACVVSQNTGSRNGKEVEDVLTFTAEHQAPLGNVQKAQERKRR